MARGPSTMKERLYIKKYDAHDCLLAIRGEKIPTALGLNVTRLCVIRGIRYHAGFGEELRGLLPEFTRTLNARRIMSGEVADMTAPDEFPYCIWHPDTAPEATYRELVRRYPQMKYHVGRACAVAGYVDLYRELDLLSEVHIAEEARENGAVAIFDGIMTADVKYAIMDDYGRSVHVDQPTKAYLNGDTAVRSYLDRRQKYGKPSNSMPGFGDGYDTHHFNITEDHRIDEYTSDTPASTEDVTSLLYTPLPPDLPTVHKDLLILMAAYYGDVDRYARLRRPERIPTELHCVVRGIYHNTMFAKWWSIQVEVNGDRYGNNTIRAAVNARFIMNNDLSRVTADTPDAQLPYLIWYPAVARWQTYAELARRKPSMKASVARACIVADYEGVYDDLDVEPDAALMAEAKDSPNPHYRQDLERKVAERGGIDDGHDIPSSRLRTRKDMFEPTTTYLLANVSNAVAETEYGVAYENLVANMSAVELNVCVPDELKRSSKESRDLAELYMLSGRHEVESSAP